MSSVAASAPVVGTQDEGQQALPLRSGVGLPCAPPRITVAEPYPETGEQCQRMSWRGSVKPRLV